METFYPTPLKKKAFILNMQVTFWENANKLIG